MVYVSSSSTLTTHPKTMDQISIKGADVMIMTALTHTPTQVRVGTAGVSILYSILVLPSKILYPLPEKKWKLSSQEHNISYGRKTNFQN